MSRRSVLLAATFYIAIGSLAAVGPASAHGFGEFRGGQAGPSLALRSPVSANIARAPIQSMGNLGGGRIGYAPSIGATPAEGNIAGARMQPLRIPAAANALLRNAPAAAQFVRPAQLPQTLTSSGIAAPRRSVDAAGIVRVHDSVATQVRDISAGEGRGKLKNPGSTNGVPNVAGPDATIFGPGSSTHGPKSSDGPTINLPGTIAQKGPGTVPGVSGSTGVQVNLPGSIYGHSPNDGMKKLFEMENANKQLLNQATKGGPNSLNTSAGTMPGEMVSDKHSGETGAGVTGENYINTGKAVEPIVNTGRPVKVWTSSGSDGNGGTVSVTNVTGPGTDRTTIVQTTNDGKTTTQTNNYDAKTGALISSTKTTTNGDGKNNTPNEYSSNSHDIGGLSAGSSIAKIAHGGGTDNNVESSGTKSSQLAPGSALGRRGNGDGTGDHGDNNRVSNDGTLAAGSVLARKDYGDGGGSDTRDGGTTTGGVKVHPGGGDPNQSNLKAAATANGH